MAQRARLARSLKPDLVVLDLMLPERTSEVCKKLPADSKTAAVPDQSC